MNIPQLSKLMLKLMYFIFQVANFGLCAAEFGAFFVAHKPNLLNLSFLGISKFNSALIDGTFG
jgi:hypothetical protein